ncbi:MAG TPA: hypothetical protein VGF17_11235, partial [Phytomonospora sp.]
AVPQPAGQRRVPVPGLARAVAVAVLVVTVGVALGSQADARAPADRDVAHPLAVAERRSVGLTFPVGVTVAVGPATEQRTGELTRPTVGCGP